MSASSSSTLLLACVAEDLSAVEWLKKQLRASQFAVDVLMRPSGHQPPTLSDADDLLHDCGTFILLISPDSKDSRALYMDLQKAQQLERTVIPVLVRPTQPLPVFVDAHDICDLTQSRQHGLQNLIARIPHQPPHAEITLGQARDRYLNRATLKSAHTIDAYRRSIELFFAFLDDNRGASLLPIFGALVRYPLASEAPLSLLSDGDASVLLHFADWMLSPGTGHADDNRPYQPSTVKLRISGVQNWLRFLDDHGLLPANFNLNKARRIVQDELRGQNRHSGPPQPPDHIQEVIYYYDRQEMPRSLRKPGVDPARIERWEMTRLRNRALLHTLAETGGRISEILSLNLADFPARNVEQNEVLRVEVIGKGGHTYYLRFLDSLPAIRQYIDARGANLRAIKGNAPLFISHAPRYNGNRMSRVIAWRVVQRAARALGLRSITPHDFRHWRATQLINAGHPLDVVQEYLGHRSVETTRAYYAHTDPLRVDDAVRKTGLPEIIDD